MSWRSVRKSVGRLILRRSADRDLDDEIRFHLAQETQRRVEAGEPIDAAQHAARRDFGSIALAKENTRAVWIPTALEQVWQDLRFGFRILTKSPGLSATAVALVVLVIGGNTTVFSIAHGIFAKPAPGVTATGLVTLNYVADSGRPSRETSYLTYQNLAAQSSTLRPMLALQDFVPVTLSHDGGSYATRATLVTANYFETLGVHLTHGRAFTEEESQGGVSGIVVMISDRAWKNYFQGAADVIGRPVRLNGLPATVVGVASSGFHGTMFGESADIWAPLVSFTRASGAQPALLSGRSNNTVAVIGRLAPGASLETANAELAARWRALGNSYTELQRQKVALVPYSMTRGTTSLIDALRERFLVILSIVTLLTVSIVCANVANILIGRAIVRQREMALRQALGASRTRIVRMLLAEGFVISIVAGVAALLSTWWFSHAAAGLINFGGETLPDFTPDWTVIAYAIVLMVVAMVAFMIAPIIRTWGLQLLTVLKIGESGVVRGRSRLSGALVILQLAFSVLLLTSAGWAYRSLFLIANDDVGFEPRNLLLVTINTDGSAGSADANAVLLDQLRERLRGIPGVEHVSYARRPVLRDGGWIDVEVRHAASEPVDAEVNHVGPGYLDVLGMAPVAGRDFSDREKAQSGRSALVSQVLAETLWPGESPVVQTLTIGDAAPEEFEVVGVVPAGNISGFWRAHRRIVLLSAQQDPAAPGETTLHIRHTGSLDAIVPAITRRLQEADARVPVVSIETAETQFDNLTSPVRLLTNLLVLFACGSLLIAAIGQYAVVAFDMQRRVREFGLRMALGASSRQVLASVLRDGSRLTVVGLAIGFALSLAVASVLRGMTYGITPTDPPTYLGVFVLLSFASLLACYLPARRASRINPMMALRHE